LADSGDTSRSVLTRIGRAFVDLILATITRPATAARARKAVQSIVANTVVQTRIGGTFIDVRLAKSARITRETSTGEEVQRISASCTILAWI
jgi:hypothetical protein